MLKDLYTKLESEDPQKSSVFFDQVCKRLKIDLSCPENQLAKAWNTVVGEESRHIVFSGYKDGIIYVKCDHPSYASLFRLNKNETLKNLRSVFPELKITDIKLAIRS